MFGRIEEQMHQLHRRLEELEMQNRELLERLEHDRGGEPAEHDGDYEHGEHEEYEHEEEYEGEHEEQEGPEAAEGEGI
jgi:hypothetical protein